MAGKRSFLAIIALLTFSFTDLFPQAATINGWRHPDYIYCSTEGGDSLVGASPSGKPFYFDGVSYTISTVLVRTADGRAIFYPDRAGPGTHTIIYGTIGSHDVTVVVTIVDKPPVTLSAFASVCSNAAPYSLFNADSSNVSPKTGRFSGPGVNASGTFNPATAGPGVHTITYTAGVGSCMSSVTRTLTVIAAPTVGINPFPPVCEGSAPLVLTQGYPAGGTYSGPGIAGGTFDPSATGIGTFPVTYTYSNGTCTNSATLNIIVSSKPVATFAGLAAQYCTDDPGINLTGNPAGITGEFSGPGITDNGNGTALFEPLNAGLGLHQIQYIYTSAQGCSDTSVQQVQIGTNVTIGGLAAHYCISSTDVSFTALPVGGSFAAAAGLTDNGNGNGVFSPSTAGIGAHTISYTFVDGNGCTNTRSFIVNVHALPIPAINDLAAEYCANNPLVTIRGNFAPSGTFNGPSIIDNGNGTARFNPAGLLPGGPYNIRYTYVDPLTGCQASVISQVTINALPSATLAGNADICHGSPATLSVTLAGTGPFNFFLSDGTGTYTENNIAGPVYNKQVFPVDTVTYSVTIVSDSKGCSTTGNGSALINVLPEVSVVSQPVSQNACPGSNIVFRINATGINLNYQWEKNGIAIPGATSASIALNNVQPADIGTYKCTVSGDCGIAITSNEALLGLWSPVQLKSDPADVYECEGSNAELHVQATGSNLTWQWYRNNVAVADGAGYSGATTNSLFISPVLATHAGNYHVVASNICGTVPSAQAIVKVDQDVIINTQPQNTTVCEGFNAVISVVATGDNLGYQWQLNNANLPGETSNVLSVPNCSNADEGFYRCIVKSGCGSEVITNAAQLIVSVKPVITVNAVSISRCEGDIAVFSITASGSSLAFQWKKNGVNLSDNARITGSQNSVLTIQNLGGIDIGNYSCVISGPCDVTVSASAALSIDTSLAITAHPASIQQCIGTNAFFSVTATGNNLAYQWMKDGIPMAGQTSSVLAINNIAAADAGQYVCRISNSCGKTVNSMAANLQINQDVVITTSPSDVEICEGDNAIFTSGASGSGITFQWEYNGSAISDNGNISGTNSATLIIQPASKIHQGIYNCLVTGICGTRRSVPASLLVNDALAITAQPQGLNVCEGNNAEFRITATGAVQYQWQKDELDLPGETNAVLVISAVNANDSGVYRCIVSNLCDTLATDGAFLEVKTAPALTLQPAAAVSCEGLQVEFESSATGSDLAWQWYRNAVAMTDDIHISGSATHTLIIDTVLAAHSGVYTAIVNGYCGNLTTNPALLTVNSSPVILSQPSSLTVCENQPASFTITVSGNVTYQWQKDNADLAGETNASLNIPSTVATDAGLYKCKITGDCGILYSNGVQLVVNSNTTITQQPADLTLCEGEQAILQSEAEGTNIAYQWKLDGIMLSDDLRISGSTAGTLIINQSDITDGGIYQCTITGSCGSVASNTATIQVLTSTAIIREPQSVRTCNGLTASFNVQAAGSGLTYQWQKDNVDIPGAQAAVYSIPAVAAGDAGVYKCIINGSCGQVISQGASLSVDELPAITLQPPLQQQICEGNLLSAVISASGTDLTYQWYFNGTVLNNGGNVSGSTETSLGINPADETDEGIYYCEISNTCSHIVTTGMQVVINHSAIINEQPANTDACEGQDIVMKVTASGDGLTYQWQKNNVNIAGAIDPVLAINNLTVADEGSYQCIIGSVCGQVISQAAQVRVFEPISVISSPPPSLSQCAGAMITMNVAVAGNAVSYQWKKNGVNLVNGGRISGSNSPALQITGIVLADEGMYTCQVSGLCNTVITPVTNLDIKTAPSIVFPPADFSALNSGNALFSVTVDGDDLLYQWYFNGTMLADGPGISGANSNILSISNVSASNEGSYFAVVTGSCGSFASNPASLTLLSSSVITGQPSGDNKCEGESVTFSIETSGSGHTYQWKKNGVLLADGGGIAGSKTAELTVTSLVPSDAGSYTCVIDNVENSTPAILTVNKTTNINFANGSSSLCAGQHASLQVLAEGGALSYAWFRNGIALVDDGIITGSLTSMLQIDPVAALHSGSYVCQVNGACGNAVSDPQVITVSDPLFIIDQPQDKSLCEGNPFTLTVTTNGSVSSWQWFRNGSALNDNAHISGTRTAALSVSNSLQSDAGVYHCVINGACNNAVSELAEVIINRNVTIVKQPAGITLCGNNLAVFSVTTNGVNASFQWQKDGVDLSDDGRITGTNSNLLSINNLQSSDAAIYRCIIIGDCNTLSTGPATLIVNNPVTISAQPVGAVICEGTNYNFSVNASGSSLSYTWMRDGVILSDNLSYSGTTTSVLTVKSATIQQAGTYQCIINGSCNNAVSDFAVLAVNKNVLILSQPDNNRICEGNDLVLHATASGSGLVYEWQKDNIALTDNVQYSGTNTDILHITDATPGQSGIYRCIITGTCGSAISNTARVEVVVPPSVNSQPANANVCEGSNLQISTAGSGDQLHYSWRFNGGNLSAADTLAQLYLENISKTQQGLYHCVISNYCGSVNSDPSTVIVNDPGNITSQPLNAIRCFGEQVSFSVNAAGDNLSYQWQFEGAPVPDGGVISGSLTRSIVITSVSAVHRGNYRCVITDGCGNTIISDPANLTLYEPGDITGIPAADTICSGESVSLTISASGSGLTYRWFRNGLALAEGNGYSGTSTSTLNITNAITGQSGYYSCEISGSCGNKLSAPIPVIVRQPVVVTGHPQSLIKCAGQTAVFTVVASGEAPIYQWLKDGQVLTDGPGVNGSATSVLVLSSLTSSSSGSYYCIVSNACGDQNSQAAALVVNQYPGAAGPVNGNALVCQGVTGLIYSVAAIDDADSYKWTLPSGMVVTSGEYSRQIEVSFILGEAGGPVYVEGVNGCGSGPASPVLSIISKPLPVAYAGESRGICSKEHNLSAYDAGLPVTGIWQAVAGPAIIDQPARATTMVRGLRNGANVFVWTTTLDGCMASDTITIYNNQVLVEAGSDTSICNHIYTLNAVAPSEGTGRWSIVYGAGYNIDRYNPTSLVSGLSKGLNVFRWSVINNGCVSYDTVSISNNLPTDADAGNDQVIQAENTTLGANSPVIGTGQWSLLNGSGTIKDPADNNSIVTNLGQGSNVFEWMISYKGCVSSDTVVIKNFITVSTDAGPDQTLCTNGARLSAKNPYPGYGEWSIKRGSATFAKYNQYDTYAYNLAPGENVFIWTQYLNGITYDSVKITNNLPTTANAGVGISVCADSVMLNANNPYIGSGHWTVVNGAGIFRDDSSNVTMIHGLARGKNTLKWTITNQGCMSSSTVTVSNNKPTDAEAGYDITTCEDTVVLNPNVPTFGTGEWSVLSGSAKFSANTAYDLGRDDNLMIYSIRNYGCYSRDTLVVTSHKPTQARLGPDQSICQDSVQLTANIPSTGSGIWSLQSGSAWISDLNAPSALARQIAPGENVFRWTVSYHECSSFDDMIISNDFIQAYAGEDKALCTDRVVLEANDPGYSDGVWTIAGGSTGASILNPKASNSIVERLASGPNTLRWTISKNACSSFDEVIIINNNPTKAFAGEDVFLCTDNVELRANPIAIGTGTWSILSGSGLVSDIHNPLADFTSMAPGINVLRWTSENQGCFSTDEVIISNNLPLNIYAGLDQQLCDDSTSLYANPPVNGTGMWSVMQGAASFDNPESYNTTVRLVGHGINRLKWTVSSTGCSITDTVVIVNNLPSRAVAGSDFPVCNSTGSLNANTPLYGTGAWTLISGAGQILNIFSPRTTISDLALGTNTLQWTITNGNCVSTDQLTIVNNSPTIADAGESAEVCGQTAILYANSPVVGTGYWSVISGKGSFSDSMNYNTTVNNLNFGDNTLRWTTQNGACLTFDEIIITNNLASVYAGEDQVVYEASALLTGNNPEKGTGQWELVAGEGNIADPSAFSGNVTNLAAGLNTFEWTIMNGSCTARDQVIIHFKIMPKIGFTVSEAEGCPGMTVDFINTTQYGTTYRWELGDGSVSTDVNPSHTYSFADRFTVRLIAFGPDNRQVTADTVITVHNKPVSTFDYAPDTAFINKPVRFYDGSFGDADNWSWDFGDNEFSDEQNPLHYYRSSGSFDITLIVTSDYGCSDTLTRNIVVAEDGILVFPNAFTPNIDGPTGGVYTENDHSNDVFHPYHENVAEFHMEIYSRWGVLLFETDDVNIGWDGYYKGQLLSRDVYVWKATGRYVSGSEFLKTGNVLLVK